MEVLDCRKVKGLFKLGTTSVQVQRVNHCKTVEIGSTSLVQTFGTFILRYFYFIHLCFIRNNIRLCKIKI